VQSAAARIRQVLVFASLDDGGVDARERKLGCEHQARRSATGDDYCVIGRGHFRSCARSVVGTLVVFRNSGIPFAFVTSLHLPLASLLTSQKAWPVLP